MSDLFERIGLIAIVFLLDTIQKSEKENKKQIGFRRSASDQFGWTDHKVKDTES